MSVKEITSKADFDALISSTPFVALETYGVWSAYCKAISPYFAKQADDFAVPEKFVFARFDKEEVPDLANELVISSMPVFIFFENGEKVKTLNGANTSSLKFAIRDMSSKAKA